MIEDLKELENEGYILDPVIKEVYYELCMEDSKFSGSTKILCNSVPEYFIDILDIINDLNIYYIKIYWTCGAYEIKVYKIRSKYNNYTEFDVLKRAMVPKEYLKSTILSYFNWITT